MRLLPVDQQLVSNPLADIAARVREQLNALQLNVPSGDVAITVGSRGIANIPLIVKTAGEWLRERGAKPFIVPSMGSHNGATAEGQQEMVESLGMSEAEMGMPIRSSMECVSVGTVNSGDVWMDRYSAESRGVLVINRIKLHTCFAGPVQSGLIKMMVVGLGKIQSARTLHSTPADQMATMLMEMGQYLVDSGKIMAGLAILEDGHDQTAEIHGIRGNQILAREPQLLEKHRTYFPRLPIDDLNVLIVDEIGKTFSGTGMDTNVVGRRGVYGHEDLDKPQIGIVAALSLADASKGNAIGVGLADFITAKLRAAIDEKKTLINVLTTGEMARGKIPATMSTDEELIDTIARHFGTRRWMFIRNTLYLSSLFVSEDLRDEIEVHERCSVAGPAVELTFREGRCQLWDERSTPVL